jgi:hypothetical protein
MKLSARLFTMSGIYFCFSTCAPAYEINNHADMSQEAANLSKLNDLTNNSKLAKLGLKILPINSSAQTFPLPQDPARGKPLGPIPYCFGSEPPRPFRVTIDNPLLFPPQQQGNGTNQPAWAAEGGARLTIAELIRYGACYEDEEEPYSRSISHFYNPQDYGRGVHAGIKNLAPNSLRWMLERNPGTPDRSGPNHFTYLDARESFYRALTWRTPGVLQSYDAQLRSQYWGGTFQALGHIAHHLQDMASPQHVRDDTHCNSEKKCKGLLGDGLPGRLLDAALYRPSAYEAHHEAQFQFIRQLARTATVPMLFGLPREFWNVNTTNDLLTSNPVAAMNDTKGIAAFTSTNFVSAATDFESFKPQGALRQYVSSPNLQFPKPSGSWTSATMTELYATTPGGVPDSVRKGICKNDLANCKMRFMGTVTNYGARTTSHSIFSQALLRPRAPNEDLTYAGSGYFSQNYWTFNDAAEKLIPKAVEYSAGLIDYFFRGELQVEPPDGLMYGLIDGGDPSSTCKDGCGFPKIKLRVRNVTNPQLYGNVSMGNGSLVAVARFSRNTCYTPDWAGEPSEGNVFSAAKTKSCLYGGQNAPVNEIVVSKPLAIGSLPYNLATEYSFDFSSQPIPVNAWNIELQVVFRGVLGEEQDAVATGAFRPISAPTVYRVLNEGNYSAILNESVSPPRLSAVVRRDQLRLNRTLLNSPAIAQSCVVGQPGSRSLVTDDQLPGAFASGVISSLSVGTTQRAAIDALPLDSGMMLIWLGEPEGFSPGFYASSAAVNAIGQSTGSFLIQPRILRYKSEVPGNPNATPPTPTIPATVEALRPMKNVYRGMYTNALVAASIHNPYANAAMPGQPLIPVCKGSLPSFMADVGSISSALPLMIGQQNLPPVTNPAVKVTELNF